MTPTERRTALVEKVLSKIGHSPQYTRPQDASVRAGLRLSGELKGYRITILDINAAIDIALEEAARVARGYAEAVKSHGNLATAPYAAAEQAADEIEAAIRAMIRG